VSVTVNPEKSIVALNVSHIDTAGNIVAYMTQPYGSIAWMRADVAGASGNGTPSGALSFLDNGSSIVNSSLNSDGVATTTQGYTAFTPGPHSITGQYAGDSSFSPNNSSAVGIIVTPATAANALTSSSNNVAEGTAVTLTATLATTSYAQGPSGEVTFLAGGAPISNGNNPVLLSSTSGSVDLQTGAATTATSTATLTSTLPIGSNSVTVRYLGDTNFTAATSAPITVNVAADFDFTPTTAPIAVTRGSSGATTFTITGHTGYNGTINFTSASCTGLPSESSCSFAPPSVVGSGTTLLSIKTTAPKTASIRPLNFWAASSGGIFTALFLLGTSSRRRRWSVALSLLLFASLTAISGCGGGSGGPPPDPGTPLGTFNITVKATDSSGVLTHNSVVTLKVQ
jgi:Bacterial Ig-like domain (group 3)